MLERFTGDARGVVTGAREARSAWAMTGSAASTCCSPWPPPAARSA